MTATHSTGNVTRWHTLTPDINTLSSSAPDTDQERPPTTTATPGINTLSNSAATSQTDEQRTR